MTSRLLIALVFLLAALPAPAKTPEPVVGKPAPAFSLMGVDGKKHSLSGYRGRPIVLIFFCGCSRRSELAQEWGSLQRSGAINADTPSGKASVTLAVMDSTAPLMRAYLASNGLDVTRSVLLPDAGGKLARLYKAAPGPRVLVLDGRGIVRYASGTDAEGEQPGMAAALAARALSALRAVAAAK